MATTELRSDEFLIKEIRERLARRRWLIEKNWWGNILFFLSTQWITFDPNFRRWRQKKLSPSVPTPVTNLFRSTLDTVKSAIAQHAPRFIGTPMRDDPRSVAAAASADRQLDIILAEGGFRRARRRMLDWLILTGNAFIECVWDDSPETGEDTIPYEQCIQCLTEYAPNELEPDDPTCEVCGGRLFKDSEDQAIVVPRGSIRFDTKSPFEIFLDPYIEELEDQPFILVMESYTKEQVLQIWGVEVDEGEHHPNAATMGREQVSLISTPGVGYPTGMQNALDRRHRVTVYRAYVKTHEKYKDGVYLVMTGAGKMLEHHTPYPWRRRGNGKKFYPYVHFRFSTLGGRAWGYTPADDLLPKQAQLNKAESLMTMIMSRMANPVWLIPTNSNPTRITGEIGTQIEYTAMGGVKPERVPGSEAPQSLVRYITDIRQAFDELSGAFSAIRGRSMGSRTPVGTVQQLQERGFGRWATVFDGLEEGYEDLARIGLEIWRQNAKSPRVRAVRNAIGGWTFEEFLAADWDDGVDVQVEAGSTRPHTQGQKLQTYMALGQAGIINLQDQAQVIKLLEDIGMTNLLPGVEEDTKAAYKENSEFMAWSREVTRLVTESDVNTEEGQQAIHEALTSMPIMVNPLVDDHAVHFLTHRRLALTPEFKTIPELVQEIFYAHMMQHKQDIFASKVMLPQAAIQQPGARPVRVQ